MWCVVTVPMSTTRTHAHPRASLYTRQVSSEDLADTARLRAVFDEDAELYDRARPGYPPQLFDDLARLAGLGPGSRVLEIGCGTGKATRPLAERGYAVVAVELGAALAAVARRTLAGFPNVRIEVAAFEDWPLPSEPFDAVFSATAFHWIDPAIRIDKSAAALRPGGALATIGTHHVAGNAHDAFFAEVQGCYERWMPGTPPGLRLQVAQDIPADADEVERSPHFEAPVFRRYEWEQAYTTAEYLDVLLTYSGHRALSPANRSGLFDCIARLVDSRYGGSIRKRYMNELRVARRR
jgi:SAM-dependent methyltransferase